jgi:hypothetical protein
MNHRGSFALKRVGPRETVDIVDNIPENVAGFGAILAFGGLKRSIFAGASNHIHLLVFNIRPF